MNRLVLLLALVAITFPVVLGGGCFDSGKTKEDRGEEDREHVEELKKGTLDDKSIKKTLKSINDKENVTICGMRVKEIVKIKRDKVFLFGDLYLRIEKMKDECDLNSLINVYKFAFGCGSVDELECIKRISGASKDFDKRQELQENKDLPIDEVGKLFDSMNQPGHIRIGDFLNASQLIERAKEDGSMESHCKHYSVYRKKQYYDIYLKSTSPSVQNFIEARYKQMLLACKQKFPDILGDSQAFEMLIGKSQSTEQTEQTLRSFVHKKDFIVADPHYRRVKSVTVQDILDKFGETSWSAKDCQPDAINKRKYWLENRRHWIPQVRNFAFDRFNELKSFCRENYGHILQQNNAARLAREEKKKNKNKDF